MLRAAAYMNFMEHVETGQLIGAVLMALVAIALLVNMGGRRLHKTMQNAAIWGLIFVGTIAAVGLWEDIQDDVLPRQATFANEGRVEIPRRFDGHYYMTLDVNGAPVEFVVDTGATEIVLTKEDAAKAGLNIETLQFFGRANTANGTVRTAPVRLDEVNIGGISDRNLPAYVNEGELFQSLLGMSYLSRWDRIEIADNTLVLTRE